MTLQWHTTDTNLGKKPPNITSISKLFTLLKAQPLILLVTSIVLAYYIWEPRFEPDQNPNIIIHSYEYFDVFLVVFLLLSLWGWFALVGDQQGAVRFKQCISLPIFSETFESVLKACAQPANDDTFIGQMPWLWLELSFTLNSEVRANFFCTQGRPLLLTLRKAGQWKIVFRLQKGILDQNTGTHLPPWDCAYILPAVLPAGKIRGMNCSCFPLILPSLENTSH